MALFKKYTDSDYVCSTWFERDRASIRLETPRGRVIFELWDEEVSGAIDDGYLPTPNSCRPARGDWQACAVSYARDKGLIE